jgi:hypothetical protein
MDLANRRSAQGYEEACAAVAPLLASGLDAATAFAPLRPKPWLVEVLRHSLEEQDRSLLGRSGTARIHDLVEEALPKTAEDATGFHPRPQGALEAFVFVGTRHASRTTREMLDDLRREGFDDLRILDLAHAVADANQWARMHRLLGLPRALLSRTGRPAEPAACGPDAQEWPAR